VQLLVLAELYVRSKMASSSYNQWFENLCKTGNISPIRLGMTRQELIETFGEPDQISLEKHSRPAGILKYGGLEFFFGQSQNDGLEMIFHDDDNGDIKFLIKNPRK
jgi:hypothetical protein